MTLSVRLTASDSLETGVLAGGAVASALWVINCVADVQVAVAVTDVANRPQRFFG